MVNWPTNGSLTAFQTWATSGASAPAATALPSASLSSRSTGDGKNRARPSSSSGMPAPVFASVTNTGISLPVATALRSPPAISAGARVSPPRYFSMSWSSVSAAASTSALFSSSSSPPPAMTSATVFLSFPRTVAGRHRSPQTARRAARVSSKLVFSLSRPVITMPRGRPSVSQRRHERFVPTWMPEAASTTTSPASATAVAATVCP